MTTDRNASCAERIEAEAKDRAQQLADLFAIYDGDGPPESDFDEADEELWNLALDVQPVTTLRVTISTGGPADGLEIVLDTDGDVSQVHYWFQDWFDGAKTDVYSDSPLWRYAEWIAEIHANQNVS